MNVMVPDPLRDWVQHRVDSGQFASVSEYVQDLISRDQALAADGDGLRRKIAAGVASLRAGKAADGETFLAVMDAEMAEMERRGA